MVILWILGVLFLALIIFVPLIERFGPRMSEQDVGKISRFVLPLMAIVLILQLLRFIF